MFLNPERRKTRDRQLRFVFYSIAALLIIVFQISIVNLIEVGGLTPNLMIILVVWISLAEGQFIGLFAGFIAGFLFDVATFDLIGTNALAQTMNAFIAGFFHRVGKEDLTLKRFSFVITVFIGSVAHNIVYFFFYLKLSELDFFSFFFKYGIATSLYTTVFGVVAILIKLPKKELNI
ncbi:MAG: rod shape-determining protein MreD [Candidatus Kapabacteria bacterium]|nr:rod shape-determining protein MreD [Ignavibacteriota bacterium]MCW5885440.1 rod shape-determining protein MreD [Candidatus Kapabacteria bacterium]